MQAINSSRIIVALLIQLISEARFPHGRLCRMEVARRVGERGISGIGYFVEGSEGAGTWGSSWTVICCTFEALSCFIVWILCCNYHFRVTIPQPLNHSPLPHDIIIHLLRSKKLQAGSGSSHATISINQSYCCNDLPTCTVALSVKVTFIKRSVYLFFIGSLMLFICLFCFVFLLL